MTFSTLVELFDHATTEFADRECFGTKQPDGAWRWITYGEFRKVVDRARGGLRVRGVSRGDRVAIISNNRVEWAATAFATYSLGAVIVPMYESQLPEEWEYILSECGPKVVVVATPDIFDAIEGMRERLPELGQVVGLDLPPSNPASYEALLRDGDESPADPVYPAPTDQAALIYTSGTTGTPKGVQLTHRNQASNVTASRSRFDFGPSDRTLAFLPWAHAFGQTGELYIFFSVGAALAINDQIANLARNLAEVRPTILVTVPRIFNRIYDSVNRQMAARPAIIQKLFQAGLDAASKEKRHEPLGLFERLVLRVANKLIFEKIRAKFGGRLRFVFSGASALSPEVAELIDAVGIDVYEGYGLTETSPIATGNYPGHRKMGSVGLALSGVEVRIDRKATGDDVHGEIIIAGPNVMTGYYNRPEETAQVLLPDGSFRTGDLGYLDEDGFLFITGRIKEQYKLENGKYVVPSPLEERLKLSPHIANIMLHGANRPHNVAVVVLDTASVEDWAKKQGKSIASLTESPDVKELIRGELRKYSSSFKGYERPRDFILTTEDFTTENGMLTPKMSLKRRNVLAKYEPALEALYSR